MNAALEALLQSLAEVAVEQHLAELKASAKRCGATGPRQEPRRSAKPTVTAKSAIESRIAELNVCDDPRERQQDTGACVERSYQGARQRLTPSPKGRREAVGDNFVAVK